MHVPAQGGTWALIIIISLCFWCSFFSRLSLYMYNLLFPIYTLISIQLVYVHVHVATSITKRVILVIITKCPIYSQPHIENVYIHDENKSIQLHTGGNCSQLAYACMITFTRIFTCTWHKT